MQPQTRLPIIATLLLLLLTPTLAADKPEAPIALTGDILKPLTLTNAQLKTDFAKDLKTIKYTVKKDNHTANTVPLISLINTAGLKLDPKIKNHLLRFVVLIEGADGYIATFTVADLTPDIGNKEVWIALDTDGKPLSDRDAPASLLIPSDAKPARWVHNIKSIKILDTTPLAPATAPATAPAKQNP